MTTELNRDSYRWIDERVRVRAQVGELTRLQRTDELIIGSVGVAWAGSILSARAEDIEQVEGENDE